MVIKYEWFVVEKRESLVFFEVFISIFVVGGSGLDKSYLIW